MSTAISAVAAKKELTIVSHSTLFYWWPVWATGFIFTLVSLFSDYRLAIVPEGTEAQQGRTIEGLRGNRDVVVVPENKTLPVDPETKTPLQPKLRITASKNIGIWFCTVLLLVIVITNVPLRGLWSVIVITSIIFLSIIFYLLHWWEWIATQLSFLDIRINLGGYFFFSLILFGIWVIVTFFFDRQIYMVFTPGQFRVRLEIGEGETVYDTTGMTIQKQRNDIFRHWILGLGSGDLVVRTSGAQAHHFDLPNVLFLGRKVKMIEEMLRERPVVAGQVP